MTKVLVTAFEPYGEWQVNSSWLTLMELTKKLPDQPELTTRLYPVDFEQVRRKLEEDLVADFDFTLHLGQAPGSTAVALERVAVNFGAEAADDAGSPLIEGGPAAFESDLPLQAWSEMLRKLGIPSSVSHHAGTYLCNATLYYALYLVKRMGLKTRCGFIHLPLDASQTAQQDPSLPSMPASLSASALLKIILELPSPA